MRLPISMAIGAMLVLSSALQAGEIPAAERTAAMPDSWLVLYNVNNPDSIAWKDFYLAAWGVPPENALGLNVDANLERIQRDLFRDQIYNPVIAYLAANPAVSARIMGILVGYRVPGNHYLDETRPPLPGGGGWSVANNLTDLTSFTYYQRPNPHFFVGYWQAPRPRLTKATLQAGAYMTARIDAPTLAEAMALTTRAQAISTAASLPASDLLYYDYIDPESPAGAEWMALRFMVQSPILTDPPERFPWMQFESETDATPSCAMHFSWYRIAGWQSVPWGGVPAGTRILGYALNSWGATTVRSRTAHNGRFVPNALFAGQYAAAIGATAEPFLGNEPDPSTIVWGLAEGWTLGEAMFSANPYRNFMWELVGDPLLRIPSWFGAPPVCGGGPPRFALPGDIVSCSAGPGATLDARCDCLDRDGDGDSDMFDTMVLFRREIAGPIGDCTGDGLTNAADAGGLVDCLTGPGVDSPDACLCADTDGDHDADLRDFCAIQRKVHP